MIYKNFITIYSTTIWRPTSKMRILMQDFFIFRLRLVDNLIWKLNIGDVSLFTSPHSQGWTFGACQFNMKAQHRKWELKWFLLWYHVIDIEPNSIDCPSYIMRPSIPLIVVVGLLHIFIFRMDSLMINSL